MENNYLNNDSSEFEDFISDECEEMKKYKWIESEKVGYDLGNQAIKDWIYKYAKQFRENYKKYKKSSII